MSFRFQRTYKLLIGKKGQDKNAIVIEPPFRLSFDIEKTVESKPNENTIKVYNLSENTRKAIEKPDLRCVLYAGYEQITPRYLQWGILRLLIPTVMGQIG